MVRRGSTALVDKEEVAVRKIAVCGKGGSGKSSVVSLLAQAMREKGLRVLVVDSDESNQGLHRKLGLHERPAPLLELVGGKKAVFPSFAGEAEAKPNVLTQERVPVADLPDRYVSRTDGIGLVSIGKILQSLEGCACPMGALSREFLKRLDLEEDEIAIVDMEAGIEHFGRGVESSLGSVLIVVDPSFDSLELAEKIHTLAAEVGIKNVWAVLNKIPSEEMATRLGARLQAAGVPVVGYIGQDAEIFESGLEGRPLHSVEAEKQVRRILEQVL